MGNQFDPARAAAEAAHRRAQEQFQLRHREANERAIVLNREAVEHDASYAPAYAGLATAMCEAMTRYGRSREAVEDAVNFARRAISLNPRLGEGYDALAFALFTRGDLRGALEVQQQGHTLDPAHPNSTARIAFLHLDLGELDEAVRWNCRALEIEPRSAYIHRNFGRLCLMFEEAWRAESWLRRAVDLDPRLSSARILLIYHLLARGERDSALAELQAMREQQPDDPETLNYAADVALMQDDLNEAQILYERAIGRGPDSRNFYRARRATTGLGYVLWINGERTAARRLIDERQAIRRKEFVEGLNAWGPPYELGAIRAVLGDPPEALAWLEHAVDRGWREPHLAETDPLLASLHGKKDFSALLERLRSRIASMKRAAGIPEPPA